MPRGQGSSRPQMPQAAGQAEKTEQEAEVDLTVEGCDFEDPAHLLVKNPDSCPNLATMRDPAVHPI